MKHMMTKSSMAFVAVIAAQVLGTVGTTHAQLVDASAVGGTPKISFATTTHDFGKINSGQPVRHDFIFTNTGSATLNIVEVKPSCGCTTAGAWDKQVEPGKTGVIPLQFNPTGFGGLISKQATVICNDPAQNSTILKLTGNVWKAIDITPTIASFIYQAEDQTNQTKVIKIVNNMDAPLTLSEVKSSHSAFQVDLKTVKEGKEFELLVTATPPFSNRTAFGSITLKTSATNMPQLGVSAHVTVQQQLMVYPEQLYLPPGPLTNAVNLAVTIRNTGSNALTLSDASVNVPGATVTMTETQPGRLFNLRANFPPGVMIQPGFQAEISAKSSHPKYPVLHVPIQHTAAASALYPGPRPVGPVASPPVVVPASTNAALSARPAGTPSRSPLPALPKQP
jgi:hypothetical protein